MDLLWMLLTLPYAPVRGLTAVMKAVQREAESRLHDPAVVRRELEELDAAAAAGEIPPEERDRRQQEMLARLVPRAAPAPVPAPAESETEGGERFATGTTQASRRRRR